MAKGPQDIADLCYHEAAELLLMTGRTDSFTEADAIVQRAIRSGAAVAKLAEVIAAQGGDARQIEQPQRLPQAPVQRMLTSPRNGYIARIHSEQIGLASMHLGAGRFKKGDSIDHRTGLVLQAKVGDYVRQGEPLIMIHARTEQEAEAIQDMLLACYQWSEEPVTVEPLIHDVIRP